MFKLKDVEVLIEKWQDILRLRDWDIKAKIVETEWRKSGDIKIDRSNNVAVLMINGFNPNVTNLEALVIHELLHVRLWDMDQMIEGLIYSTFGTDESDEKFKFAYGEFMRVLESTTENLTKGFLAVGAENKEIPFGYVDREVEKEISKGMNR